MFVLTSEQILSNLPFLLLLWTALTLCWGVYVGVCFKRMINFAVKCKGGCRPDDTIQLGFLWFANALLFFYLFFEPQIPASIGDAIIVINIFFSSYLTACTSMLIRWYRSKSKTETPSP